MYLDGQLHISSVTVSGCLNCPGRYPADLEVWVGDTNGHNFEHNYGINTHVGTTPDAATLEADNRRTSATVRK